jgi:hypothetical protein
LNTQNGPAYINDSSTNNFTVTKTDIVISSPSVGEVRIYVPNLTYALQQKLMVDYLATRKMAGIVLSYGQ